MPIANVIRIMRRVLPAHAKISDDAKETIQECVSEYISFITGEANARCQREQRKTINAEDVLSAMSRLGFDDYVEPLSIYLHRYREFEGEATTRCSCPACPPRTHTTTTCRCTPPCPRITSGSQRRLTITRATSTCRIRTTRTAASTPWPCTGAGAARRRQVVVVQAWSTSTRSRTSNIRRSSLHRPAAALPSMVHRYYIVPIQLV
jgi:histone H3/H4